MTTEEDRGDDRDLKEQLAQQDRCRVVTVVMRLPIRAEGFAAILRTIADHFPETQLRFAADGAWLIEIAEPDARGADTRRLSSTDLIGLAERIENDE